MCSDAEQHVSVSFLRVNESGLFVFPANTVYSENWSTLETGDPFENEVEFLPF